MDMEMRCTESPESLLSGKGAKEECLVQTAKVQTVKKECLRTECLTRAKGACPFKVFKYICTLIFKERNFINIVFKEKNLKI